MSFEMLHSCELVNSSPVHFFHFKFRWIRQIQNCVYDRNNVVAPTQIVSLKVMFWRIEWISHLILWLRIDNIRSMVFWVLVQVWLAAPKVYECQVWVLKSQISLNYSGVQLIFSKILVKLFHLNIIILSMSWQNLTFFILNHNVIRFYIQVKVARVMEIPDILY